MFFKTEICKQLSDRELIQKSLEDVNYFACLVLNYEQKLLNYIRKISQSTPEEAEDILQDSFIKIWKNLRSFDKNLKLENWIFRIVHNEAISFYRQKSSFGKDKTIEISDELLELKEKSEISTEEPDLQTLIDNTLPLLKIEHRDVLVLKYIENKSYEEISDILKIPENTVASRLSRAKQAFKTLAENTFDLSILNKI
ncbi:MAG: RNA polymerase sigma factor [Saprospiraceae bacterium]|nr:RNA polymerase sigma factor [Saprospiraceae bacterium]MBK6563617.1 RNA polymerase sigma factor [Saprospiraceae bacterium]MBK8371272.1 RNA polymerase sigma factor [Saprospiraceae bacterium]MBK8545873.1 RNA polymerase sigma factor [Saprospiraceae bacterium]MBK8853865.1 RNA polymerase sigma factor [Saprospiraceae bacterium]